VHNKSERLILHYVVQQSIIVVFTLTDMFLQNTLVHNVMMGLGANILRAHVMI
jgi:hypothetical protein